MGPAIAFSISLLALLGFLWFKQWEEATGKTHLMVFRGNADRHVLAFGATLRNRIPRPHPDLAKQLIRFLAHEVTVILLRVVHIVERRLLTVVNMIKGRGTVGHSASASEYLQKIAEHKKSSERGKIE